MKMIKWKILCITSLVCLLPILFGIFIWDRLPETMAIHFNIHNQPDNFAPKGFVVFGLPVLMVLLQCICCVTCDINSHKHGERKKFERATKWIIPAMSIILQVATIGYSLGWGVDIRKVAATIVGCVLLTIGNYLPKLDYVKNFDVNTEKARKINRFIGYETTVIGICFLISLFFPPVATGWCLLLFIPYVMISTVYSIKVSKE